jgi:hypothetical protein
MDATGNVYYLTMGGLRLWREIYQIQEIDTGLQDPAVSHIHGFSMHRVLMTRVEIT